MNLQRGFLLSVCLFDKSSAFPFLLMIQYNVENVAFSFNISGHNSTSATTTDREQTTIGLLTSHYVMNARVGAC